MAFTKVYGKTLSRLPWIWISMDIYVLLISDLGQPRKYDISGIRIISNFTICDADILLLLRMFYDSLFFFSSYSSFSPNLPSLLLSGNERDNLNFNAIGRMVSIRGRLF